MPKGQWSTRPQDVSYTTDPEGGFEAIIPLLDNGVKQGDLRFVMTSDRTLFIYWEEVINAVGLSDFQAWWKEA